MEFPKKYTPEEFEEKIYSEWENNWFFKEKNSKTKENYYIPMPPPNITWVLHLGHTLMLTIQDIIIRYHRMKWDSTLWIPWKDHAWISTQIKVEEQLEKNWKTKHDISREEFLKLCWDWKNKYGDTITKQIRKTWASCDWSKEKFTLDEWLNEKVNQAFIKLYEKWLIYRGEYMVNYDTKLNSVISNQEIIYKEEKWFLYYISYFVSWSDNEIIIATTRPETLLWDVAIAVNPKDKRYKKFLKWNKKVILPIVNKEIPIIWDESVDMEFWTWALKITPAHDATDFEIARKNKLALNNIVIDKDGKMTKIAWIFAWQNYLIARENIVELLKAKWNLIKIETNISKVAYWERSNAKIDTIISTQWFIKTKSLAKKVLKWYKEKEFEIIPKRFNKIFEDWMANLWDWCISRQLIWWHRIPVWYSEDKTVFCALNEKEAQKLANNHYDTNNVKLIQDNDVLDTWFSSALWPFSILDMDMNIDNISKQSDLFKKFYPASILETWHDIIFFWVIRMLLFSYEFTNQTAFKKIYFHWIIKDKEGRKMSKSLWNWIDPIDIIKLYWTDALRLTLSIWNTAGNDLKFDEENVKNNSLFINKLWNACRFVSINIEENNFDTEKTEKILIENYKNLMHHEKWILSRIKYISDAISKWMEKYDFSEPWLELQAFTKNEFCDYYIEEFKITKNISIYWQDTIFYVINKILKLWHPYIPFVSEELYNKLWFKWNLIVQDWWTVNIERNEKIEKEKRIIIEIVREIRRLRTENNILASTLIWVYILKNNNYIKILNNLSNEISWLVKADKCEFIENKLENNAFAYWITKSWIEFYIDTTNSIDIEKELTRIKDEISDTKEYIYILDKKLLNENFVKNAPENLIRLEMEKKIQAKEKLARLEEKLSKMI